LEAGAFLAYGNPVDRLTTMSEDAIYFSSRRKAYMEFSNFAPYGFEEDGVTWPTVEHYYQAQKFLQEEYANHRQRIREASSAQAAKSLGRSKVHALRPDWEQTKDDVMRYALARKFENAGLRQLLLSTGSRLLIEDSPDWYWGIGKDGTGENRLGCLLMELRESFRELPRRGSR
jgi:ribA/ribD-fused uncharacterized protein